MVCKQFAKTLSTCCIVGPVHISAALYWHARCSTVWSMSSHGLRCLSAASQTSESSWKHAGMPMKHAGHRQLTAYHDGRLVQAVLHDVEGQLQACHCSFGIMTNATASGMPIMPAQHVSDSVQLFCAGPRLTPTVMLFNLGMKPTGANGRGSTSLGAQ